MTYLAYASTPWLTLLILSPLVGLALTALAGALRLDDRTVIIGATAWSTVPLALAIIVWVGFNPNATADGQGVVQFVEKIPWVQAIRVDYFVGVDGISMPLVILTAAMTPVAMLASFSVTPAGETVPGADVSAGNGNAGVLPGAQFLLLLHLLGIQPGSGIFSHSRMGTPPHH
jgi:NADH:ubiquinone oxidoreductase subunit 4 (subunit M)